MQSTEPGPDASPDFTAVVTLGTLQVTFNGEAQPLPGRWRPWSRKEPAAPGTDPGRPRASTETSRREAARLSFIGRAGRRTEGERGPRGRVVLGVGRGIRTSPSSPGSGLSRAHTEVGREGGHVRERHVPHDLGFSRALLQGAREGDTVMCP